MPTRLDASYRNTILISMTFVLLGTGFAGAPNVVLVAVSCFIIGLGMGLVATPSIIAAQASVAWNERGVVTGASQFARSIGSAVGVAIFGAIAHSIFGREPVAGVVTLVAARAMPRTPAADPTVTAEPA